MPLDTEVGLGLGDIVLDEDPAHPQKGAQPPIFGPCLMWPNGWMEQDANWYTGRPRSRPHFFTWGMGTQLPSRKESEQPPLFGPGLYAVAHLSYCCSSCFMFLEVRRIELYLQSTATYPKWLNKRKKSVIPHRDDDPIRWCKI